MSGLNGRLARLEATLRPDTGHCRACGLRHVQPLTIELVRRLIGPVSVPATAALSEAAQHPAPKLCLCDPRDRWLARLSHGIGG
jgi:hypothetical protein